MSKSSKPSKFNGVFQNRQGESANTDEVKTQDTDSGSLSQEVETVETLVQSSPDEVLATRAKKIGRPFGKRSDPNYTQVTAYIRNQTYRDVKIALLLEGEKREFSELVEDLLGEWLSTQKSNYSKL